MTLGQALGILSLPTKVPPDFTKRTERLFRIISKRFVRSFLEQNHLNPDITYSVDGEYSEADHAVFFDMTRAGKAKQKPIRIEYMFRIGELLGLTWDCVDVSEKSLAEGKPYIHVTKELQRVSKGAKDTLEDKDVIRIFPKQKRNARTVLVLKKPKTETSVRKVFLPETAGLLKALVNAMGNEESK